MHHDFPEPLCQKTSVGDKCIQIGTHGDGLSAETEEMAISPGAPQSWTPGACPADYGIPFTPRTTRRLWLAFSILLPGVACARACAGVLLWPLLHLIPVRLMDPHCRGPGLRCAHPVQSHRKVRLHRPRTKGMSRRAGCRDAQNVSWQKRAETTCVTGDLLRFHVAAL